MNLADLPDELLIEELARRARVKARRKPDGLPWCEECRNFRIWDRAGDPPKHYNPCIAGHDMQFHTPEPHESYEDYGFFRAVCEDRQ